jgi:hypothetical protein
VNGDAVEHHVDADGDHDETDAPARAYLESIARQLSREAGVNVRHGRPATEVIAAASEHEEPVVVLTTRGYTGMDGPNWLNDPTLALGIAMLVHIWKSLPFWTLILIAGRLAIPAEHYEAASVDGATQWQKFRYITWPTMRTLRRGNRLSITPVTDDEWSAVLHRLHDR